MNRVSWSRNVVTSCVTIIATEKKRQKVFFVFSQKVHHIYELQIVSEIMETIINNYEDHFAAN